MVGASAGQRPAVPAAAVVLRRRWVAVVGVERDAARVLAAVGAGARGMGRVGRAAAVAGVGRGDDHGEAGVAALPAEEPLLRKADVGGRRDRGGVAEGAEELLAGERQVDVFRHPQATVGAHLARNDGRLQVLVQHNAVPQNAEEGVRQRLVLVEGWPIDALGVRDEEGGLRLGVGREVRDARELVGRLVRDGGRVDAEVREHERVAEEGVQLGLRRGDALARVDLDAPANEVVQQVDRLDDTVVRLLRRVAGLLLLLQRRGRWQLRRGRLRRVRNWLVAAAGQLRHGADVLHRRPHREEGVDAGGRLEQHHAVGPHVQHGLLARVLRERDGGPLPHHDLGRHVPRVALHLSLV
mmetsp:Transcript_14527/g.45062  ORF Transcript_14527/g.45062 Transcript_14527/m.45062 type:complete len:354 (-) Transcript_14527:191-1252(-)